MLILKVQLSSAKPLIVLSVQKTNYYLMDAAKQTLNKEECATIILFGHPRRSQVFTTSIYYYNSYYLFKCFFHYKHILYINKTISHYGPIEYTLVKEFTEIKGCDHRLLLGDFGDISDAETRCAEAVQAKSSCGEFFFFAASKGRCACQKKGYFCPRTKNKAFNEFRITFGEREYHYDTIIMWFYLFLQYYDPYITKST